MFGEGLARLVEEVTDDKALAKQERKRLPPPPYPSPRISAFTRVFVALCGGGLGWAQSVRRRLEYVEWAKRVAAGLTGVSSWLEQEFEEAAK